MTKLQTYFTKDKKPSEGEGDVAEASPFDAFFDPSKYSAHVEDYRKEQDEITKAKAFKYTPKTPDELERLAWDMLGGQVFGTWFPNSMNLFMIAMFMRPELLKRMEEENIIHFYEYISEAGPRSINGLPIFFSANYINKDDWKILADRYTELYDMKNKAVEKAKPLI